MANPYEELKKKFEADRKARRAREGQQFRSPYDSLDWDDIQRMLNNARQAAENAQHQAQGQRYYYSAYTERVQPRRSMYEPTWCKVLGLPATATKQQIKSAYRKLALRHHPDKGGDATEFNKIQTAYEEAMR